MATWTSLGHAMRRRMGAPSNHLESAGKKMSKELSPEQVVASGARAYMGSDAYKFNNASGTPAVGKLMPKKSTQAADPTINNKANRTNIERAGAQYRITAKMPAQTSPEAGATMMNARTIPSVVGRQNPNFQGGMGDSY
jgi:hypothetical protein